MTEAAPHREGVPPTSGPDRSGWISVRCIFHTQRQGSRFFEERITLWRSTSMDEAVQRAEAAAHEYAHDTSSEGDTVYAGLAQAYLLADAPSDGAEVYSLIRGSDLTPESYLDAFFDTGTERSSTITDDDHEPGEGLTTP